MTTLHLLAERFRRFNFDKPEPESYQVFYKNDSSVGNRYIRWRGIWAYKHAPDGAKVVSIDKVYDESAHGACEWRHLFEGIHYGLINGPKTLAAVDECLEILKNDKPPEDDGEKVRHVNRMGGVNWLSKPTFHSWELTSRLGTIMSNGFFADRKDRSLYNEDFVYVYDSHSGWNRSM